MSGIDVVLDTNIIIGYLGGRSWAVSFICDRQSTGVSFGISQITRMELLCFPALTVEEESAIHAFLDCVIVIGLTDAIENRAIQLRRTHRTKLPDAIVAATAIEHGATLVTCDADLAALNVGDLSVENPQGT